MTYRTLQMYINGLHPEQLDMDVSIYDASEDEFYSLVDKDNCFQITEEDDVLDANHPYIVVKDWS